MTVLKGQELQRCTGVARHAGRANASIGNKTLHLMRHGTTEMNVYLRDVKPYGSPGFKDPLFFDTRLTKEGAEGARRAAATAKALAPKPELLVVSPLARAMETAQLAWLPHYDGPAVVEALARERVWLSSDCGSHPEKLAREFGPSSSGRFTFDHLPDIWWWTNGVNDPHHIHLEPEAVFSKRVAEFRNWLLDRPESTIAIVAHWGLLMELTHGADFDNCEIRTFSLLPNGKLQQLQRISSAATTR